MPARLERIPLPRILLRFWLAMAGLTALSIFWTGYLAYRYKLTAPYNLPLLWDDNRWGDLLFFRPAFLHFRTPQFWASFTDPFSYPAPLGVALGAIYKFPHPVDAYMLLCLAALASACRYFVRQLVARGVARVWAWAFTLTTLVMTWPLLFLIDTSNLEGLVVMTLAAGIVATLRGRYWLGATLIGIAGSMKVFPLVLLALLLSKRRYREFAWGLIATGLSTLTSLAILGPNIVAAERHLNAGFALAKERLFFSLSRLAPSFDHSLWMPVRFAVIYMARWMHPLPPALETARTAAVLTLALRTYLLLAASAGVALYFLKIRRMPLLNQVMALTICAVLLPPLSLEYTLVHMLLPFGLLCAYAADMERSKVKVKGLGACFVCFVFVFNVQSFLTHRYTFASEARLIALVALLIVVLSHPFAWPNARTAEVPA